MKSWGGAGWATESRKMPDRLDGGLSHPSIQAALRQLVAPEILSLKLGARVMLLKNLRLPSACRTLSDGTRQMPLVNGSTGKVIDIRGDGGAVTVQFSSARQRCQKMILPAEFAGEIQGVGKYCRSQFPLRLAWAITVHKCQGMTLDGGHVDLSHLFEPAQMYVALSRFRNFSELRLEALPPADRLKQLAGNASGAMRKRAARFHEDLEQPRANLATTTAHPDGDTSADDSYADSAGSDTDGDTSADELLVHPELGREGA
ncbi:unnamed protein product [Prorocentrum cordatum]|uniref:ATP-dependent DNA helicase n=1 Tax=Prorocentrum cordatum TaxID=2364126 RepID=A0ABN9RZP3_9DINO|nr:unnamed protein product [Polarella glacialis]